jgi:ubiquinone/menaquinone biosynthesis C-methylase UbiE/DNA-binding transcriptional ArsR family regulator
VSSPTTSPPVPAAPALLRGFAEPTRLRILALVQASELTVGELSRALGMAQSRVSNQLRVLRELGLLAERHVGSSTFVRAGFGASTAHGDGDGEDLVVDRAAQHVDVAARLWHVVADDVDALPERAADRVRLAEVLAARGEGDRDFFDRLAGDWDKLGSSFKSGLARARAAASLMPRGLVIGDLGCGTGWAAREFLGNAARLICIDRSPGMLLAAKRSLGERSRGTLVEYREGELDALPLPDRALDGAVAALVLHHLAAPDAALREALRVLKPGASLAVVELAPHDEAWMHAELGDRHLGLVQDQVVRALERAGFEDVEATPLDDSYEPTRPDGSRASVPLYLVRGRAEHGVCE